MLGFCMSNNNEKRPKGLKWTLRSFGRSIVEHAPVTIVYSIVTILALLVHHRFSLTSLTASSFENEVNAITAGVFIIVLSIVTRPIYLFVFAKLRIYFVARQVVRSSGIESFWPHTAESRGQGWDGLLEVFRATKPDTIRILAFTGASTFSNRDSPLHEALKHHRGNIEILLAERDTEGFKQRLGKLREKFNTTVPILSDKCYEELEQSVGYCKSLEKDGPEVSRVEIRQYDCEPIWKMVIFGNYLWLQYYRPGQVNDDMPAFGFTKTADTSLAYPLHKVFDVLWSLGATKAPLYKSPP